MKELIIFGGFQTTSTESGGLLFGDFFFFLSSVLMKKYSDMIPKKIRKQPSAIRRLRFISISCCVVIGIETNDRKPPMTRMSPSIKLPASLSFDINKLNHIFHNNLFGGFQNKKTSDYLDRIDKVIDFSITLFQPPFYILHIEI